MHGSEAMIELAQERVDRERDLKVAAIRATLRDQSHAEDLSVPRECRCGEVIPAARRRAVPNTFRCIDCATGAERKTGAA